MMGTDPGAGPDSCGSDNDEDPALWMPLDRSLNISEGDDDRCLSRTSLDDTSASWTSTLRSVVPGRDSIQDGSSVFPNQKSNAVIQRVTDPRQQQSPHRSRPGPNTRHTYDGDRLGALERRLETRKTLKEGLVDRPLNQFAGKLISHLLRELWVQDYCLRTGLALLVIGSLMQIMSFMLIGNSVTRAVLRNMFVIVVLIASYLHFYRPDETLRSALRLLSNSSFAESFFQTLESLEPCQIRRLCLLLLVIPTLLEMKAISFLASIIFESGWIVNIITTALTFAYLYHSRTRELVSPRLCSLRGLICLKTFALLVTIIFTRDLKRINALAGPFVFAAGAFLVSNHPSFESDEFDWLSKSVRRSLRLTLRDVLVEVGQDAGENEMLQLAMVRWCVDYWSRPPTNNGVRSNTGSSANPDLTSQLEPVGNPLEGDTLESEAETNNTRSNYAADSSGPCLGQSDEQRVGPIGVSDTSRQIVKANGDRDIEWGDLWAMLNTTTDQMVGEVGHLNIAPESSQSQSRVNSDNDSPVANLKVMLESLDVDGKAKPAIQSYKSTIENIPPSRNIAIVFSLGRRCPAALVLLMWYSTGSFDSLCATLTLLPCIWMETERLKEWLQSFHRAVEMEDSNFRIGRNELPIPNENLKAWVPHEIEPMTILLSSDAYSPYHPSSSQQVWANVKASVGALESGMTAVRCVHTTCVATALTFNVVSLAQFGVEVYSKGWLQGTALVAKDLMTFVATGQERNRARRGTGGQFTEAAVNAARNSQVMAKNVTILMKEEGGNELVKPAVDLLGAVVGKGWLWGKEEEEDESTKKDIDSENINYEDDRKGNGDNDVQVGEENEKEKQCSVDEPEARQSSDDPRQASVASADSIIGTGEDDSSRGLDSLNRNEGSIDFTAETMDLMAEAFEKSLITADEKNRFMEMIVQEKQSESADKPSIGALTSIRKSLECVILEPPSADAQVPLESDPRSKMEEEEATSAAQDVEQDVRKDDETKDHQIVFGEGNRDDDDEGEEGTSELSETASAPLESSGTTSDSWENAGSANMVVLDSGFERSGKDQPMTSLESNNQTRVSVTQIDNLDIDPEDVQIANDDREEEDEGSWTAIDAEGVPVQDSPDLDPFSGGSVRSRSFPRTSSTPRRSTTTSSQQQEGEKHDWMGGLVLGGLAVAGAVAAAAAGGVALANAGKDGSGRTRQSMDRKSTVTIELLDSDDDEES